MNKEQFFNQHANWQDKNYTYAIHVTNGRAMYLYQIDGLKVTDEDIAGANIIRLDGINLEELVRQIQELRKVYD